MKTIAPKKAALLALTLLSAAVLWSCDSDSDDERNKFLGRYDVEEQSLETHSPRDDYEVNIIRDPGSQSRVIISGFYEEEVEVYARVDGNKIFVENEIHNIYEFNGSGILSGTVLTMEYTVSLTSEDTGYLDRLRAEMVRKD